eukprot:UN01766
MCPQYLTMLGEDDDNESNLIDQRTGKPIPQPYVTNYVNNTNILYVTAQDTALTTKLDSRVNNLFTQGGGSYGCLVPLLYTSQHQHNPTLVYNNNNNQQQQQQLQNSNNNDDGDNDINNNNTSQIQQNTIVKPTTCCFVDLNIPEETSNAKTFFEQDDDDYDFNNNNNNNNKNPHIAPKQQQQQQQQRPGSSDFFHDSTVNILKEPTHPTNQNNDEFNNKNNNNNNNFEQNKIDVNTLTYTNNLQFIEPMCQFPYFSHRASCLEVLNNVKLTYDIQEQRFILHPQNFEPNPQTGMLTITNTIFVGLDNGSIHVFLHEFNIHANDYFIHQPSLSNDNNNNNNNKYK